MTMNYDEAKSNFWMSMIADDLEYQYTKPEVDEMLKLAKFDVHHHTIHVLYDSGTADTFQVCVKLL